VVGKELELEEQEEYVVYVGLVDELECSVSNEHLLHLFGDSEHDRVAMENSVVWLSDRKRWDSVVPDCSSAERANRAGDLVSAGRSESVVGAGELPWLGAC
jgi:hypothetical protein